MSTGDFQVEPISGALGARVTGLDFRKITDAQFELLLQAWHQYLVLFLVGQEIDPPAQQEFARRFGPIRDRGWERESSGPHSPRPVAEDATAVVRVVEDTRADAWHSDMSFRRIPTVGSVFQYVEGPPAGGDTMWSNQYLAFETLSEPLREMLLGLTAQHVAAAVLLPERAAVHPVVRVHPVTGRPCLYVNRAHTSNILELSRAESNALLRLLFEHNEQPRFVCRWHWSPGDIAIWDNRCTMHHAVNDYGAAHRLAHRVMIKGDKPAAYRESSWTPQDEWTKNLSVGVATFMGGPA